MKTRRILFLCIGLVCLSICAYNQQPVKPTVESESGDFFGKDATYGLVLKSDNGTCHRLRIINDGTVITENVACPDAVNTSKAQLVCPNANFVLTDPTQFEVNVIHTNPTSQVVNYDPRINDQDPGNSFTYDANNAVQSQSYDISGQIPTVGSGSFTLGILYWYDGDVTTMFSTETCEVNYDFEGSANDGKLITCDNTRLARAAPFEAMFHSNFQRLKTTLRNFGTTHNDAFWLNNGAYCGETGLKMYHYKAPVESIARMMLYAHAMGLTSHVQDYKEFLWETLNDIMPKYFSGDGTAGTTSGSDYQCGATKNPAYARHRFLDSSRLMTWSGYAITALIECGVSVAEQSKIDSWSAAIKPAIARFQDNMTTHCNPSNGGFSHMGTHPLAGSYLWSTLSGYTDFNANISSNLTSVLNSYQATSGNLGSDIGHDTDSMSNISTIRDNQILTGQSTGPQVTENMMQLIGNKVAERINSGEQWPGASGAYPGFEHVYALAAGFSQAMDNLISPATDANYPALAGSGNTSHLVFNTFVSVASAAWGYAMKGDAENCPE